MLWPKHLLHCAEKINAPAKSPAHQQKHPMQIPRVTSKNQGQFESLWDDHKRTSLRVSGIHALMRLDPKRLDQQVRHARDSGTISFLPALLKGSLECALTDCRWKKCSQHNSKLHIPNSKGKSFILQAWIFETSSPLLLYFPQGATPPKARSRRTSKALRF